MPVWPIEQLAAGIVDLELHRQRRVVGSSTPGVVHVVRLERRSDRRGRAVSNASAGDVARRARRRPPAPAPAARRDRCARCGTAARLRRTTRRASPITSATRPAIGARSTNALPAAAPPPLRSVSSRCASRASAACSRASATVDRPARVFDAPGRNGALGQQPFGARLLGARALRARPAPRRPRPRAWRDRRRPSAAARGVRAPGPARPRSPIDGSVSAVKRPGGRRRHDRFAAR